MNRFDNMPARIARLPVNEKGFPIRQQDASPAHCGPPRSSRQDRARRDMRTPTPHRLAFAWHSNALKGVSADEPVEFTEDPECGWFKRKLVKNGPFTPCRIWLEAEIDEATGELLAPEELLCEVNGARADAEDQWPWLCSNPISEAEFNYMEALRRHAAWHEPDHPMANPRKPIDHLTTPLHF